MNTSTMIRVAKTIELRISPDALKMTAAGVWTMADWAFCRKMMLFSMDTPSIPLLAEEGWRDSLIEAGAPGAKREPDRAKPQLVVSSARRVAGLLLRLRPIGLALRATPSAPSLRSAQPPLLCEEGNAKLFSLWNT